MPRAKGAAALRGARLVTVEGAVDGARWALTVVFALAAAEKGSTLRRGGSAWHPVMLVTRRRRRHAARLMMASLVADVCTLALLYAQPVLGALVASLLVGAYTLASWGVHAGAGDCRCLWRSFNSRTRRGLLVRNLFIVLLGGTVGIWRPLSAQLSAVGLAWAAGIVATLAVAIQVADRSGERRQAAGSSSPAVPVGARPGTAA